MPQTPQNNAIGAPGSDAMGETFAFIAHEIRTPLGAMMSLSELLSETPLDDNQRHYVKSLQSAATSLLAILNDLLDHEKLATGEMELAVQAFDPITLMREIETLFTPMCSEKGLQIGCVVPPAPMGALLGDPHRLRQIMTNFINNAVKFTESGGVVLQLDAMTHEDGAVELVFSVTDTGIGISEEAQEKLFTPYTQAEATTAAQYGGTGLGLAITQKLAGLMDGDVGCQSVPGQGSSFWLRLKCAQAQAGAQPSPELAGPQTNTSAAIGLTEARILVAEDNRINRTLISTYLNRFGCAFEFADNGQIALGLAQQNKYDIILMDIHMPIMNGIEATNAIRALPQPYNAVPILALTADNPQEAQEKFIEKGFDGYVPKPIKPDLLYTTLCSMTGIKDRRLAGMRS